MSERSRARKDANFDLDRFGISNLSAYQCIRSRVRWLWIENIALFLYYFKRQWWTAAAADSESVLFHLVCNRNQRGQTITCAQFQLVIIHLFGVVSAKKCQNSRHTNPVADHAYGSIVDINRNYVAARMKANSLHMNGPTIMPVVHAHLWYGHDGQWPAYSSYYGMASAIKNLASHSLSFIIAHHKIENRRMICMMCAEKKKQWTRNRASGSNEEKTHGESRMRKLMTIIWIYAWIAGCVRCAVCVSSLCAPYVQRDHCNATAHTLTHLFSTVIQPALWLSISISANPKVIFIYPHEEPICFCCLFVKWISTNSRLFSILAFAQFVLARKSVLIVAEHCRYWLLQWVSICSAEQMHFIASFTGKLLFGARDINFHFITIIGCSPPKLARSRAKMHINRHFHLFAESKKYHTVI